LRMEEAEKYRKKMDVFVSEMEQIHVGKVNELKRREGEMVSRIHNKQREVEAVAYSHR